MFNYAYWRYQIINAWNKIVTAARRQCMARSSGALYQQAINPGPLNFYITNEDIFFFDKYF